MNTNNDYNNAPMMYHNDYNEIEGLPLEAREKLNNDIDKLRQGLHLNCLDKYLPLIYNSGSIASLDGGY